MIPVLEFKVELLSNHRWRVTDGEGRELMAEKALDVGYAVRNLLDLRVAEQQREREIRLTTENLRRLTAEAETILVRVIIYLTQ